MSAARALAALVETQAGPWHVCEVTTANGDRTVDIAYLDTVVDHVTCLNGFVPAVGDLVLVLTSDEIGWIVLGLIPRRSVVTDA